MQLFICTGFEINFNYLIYSDKRMIWGFVKGKQRGNVRGMWTIFSLVPKPPCHISMN